MRSRRADDVFVIGEERLLDEAELGVEVDNGAEDAPAVRGADRAEPLDLEQELRAARPEDPTRVIERRPARVPRPPDGLGRWMVGGVTMGSALLVVVLIALSASGGGERPVRVTQTRPVGVTPAPEREPRNRGRERDAGSSASAGAERAEAGPRGGKSPAVDGRGWSGSAGQAAASPSPEPAPEPVGPPPVTSPVAVVAPAPTVAPTAPTSSGSATVASAAEVRQEFGP